MASNSARFVLTTLVVLFTFQIWTCICSSRRTYIVHMDVSSMPSAFTSQNHWYDSLLSSENFAAVDASTAALPPSSLLYTYSNAMHGFSAVLSESQLELLKKTPGFVSAYQDRQGNKQTTHTFKYLGLSHVVGIWPKSRYGKDVIIRVLNTDVWPENLSFRDDGMTQIPKRWKGKCEIGTAFNASMCNKKLIGARYFNKGIIAQDPNVAISMNSARDTNGHGTHVASTAAGNYVSGASYFGYAKGKARGVAPRARIAVYKVINEEGMVASDVIAAMDQAIADGVDVLSLSLSFGRNSIYEDPISLASFAAMEKGVLISTSAGNTGGDVGSPMNCAPWVLSVGATTIDRRFSGIATLGNEISLVRASLYVGNKSVKKSPLYYNESDSACDSTETLQNRVKGKVVVCEYDGDDTSVSQTSVVANAEGVSVLLLTSSTIESIRAKDYGCPASVLNVNDSAAVKEYVRTSKHPKVSQKFIKTFTDIKPVPMLAPYSSKGPAIDTPTILKPDIVVPGTLILAAHSTNSSAITVRGKELFTNFTLLSGTSMACPHASGLAALLKSVHPDWSPSVIRSAMMTTSNVLDNEGQTIYDGQSPLGFGAGEINPNKAMDPGLVYDAGREDYVKFLCALNLTREQFQASARNSSDYDRCGAGGVFYLNYPAFVMPLAFGQTSGVQKFKRTVTNVGDDGPVTYRANLTRITGYRVTVAPKMLVFQRRNQKASFVLTLEVKRPAGGNSFGFLTWLSEKGKHVVRSPILALTG